MAVKFKFIHFNTRSGFDSYVPNPELNSAEGNEFYNYVVFIRETKEIYTHGQFYGYDSDVWDELDNYYTKDEVDGKISQAITNTLNTEV